MATVHDVISAAHRKLGILDQREDLDAHDAADSLFALNIMMHGWAAFGVDVEHTDVALADAFPLADKFIEGTIYLLASRIAPDYMVPQSFDADVFWRMLQAEYTDLDDITLTLPEAILSPPSRDDRDGTLPTTVS